MVAGSVTKPAVRAFLSRGEATADAAVALPALGSELRSQGWELALEVIDEGLADDMIPSLARLGRLAQLGDLPTFIAELGREVERRRRPGCESAGRSLRSHATTLGSANRSVSRHARS